MSAIVRGDIRPCRRLCQIPSLAFGDDCDLTPFRCNCRPRTVFWQSQLLACIDTSLLFLKCTQFTSRILFGQTHPDRAGERNYSAAEVSAMLNAVRESVRE
jgi:hypothetical protein